MNTACSKRFFVFAGALFAGALFLFSCASLETAQAEEFFSIGMAYYEMGKFAEAEKWLNRARAADKTLSASEYNLGRIAFETGRYEEAALLFESIIAKDPENVMALKAAAYSRIKNGDLERAEELYSRVLDMVPESADDGFNYALVLYGLEKYEICEAELNKHFYALEENPASMLLFARAQKAQNKIEAVDSYAKWALANSAAYPRGLYEYAQALEAAGFYARALEQYNAAISALAQTPDVPAGAQTALTPSGLRFEMARLLLTADPENESGIAELKTAVSEGFSDAAALEELLKDERISAVNKDEMSAILLDLQSAAAEAAAAEAEAAVEAEAADAAEAEGDPQNPEGTETPQGLEPSEEAPEDPPAAEAAVN